MGLKETINRRRKEGESTKAAAKRLAADKDAGIGHRAAKTWLANKSRKPVKKNVPKRMVAEPTTAATTNSKSKRK